MYWLRGPCRDYSPRDRAQGPCSRLQIFCPAHLLPLPRHPHIFASVRICSSYISCHKRPPFFASPQLCRPDQKFHEDTCCSSQPRWTSLSSMYLFSLVYLCSESPHRRLGAPRGQVLCWSHLRSAPTKRPGMANIWPVCCHRSSQSPGRTLLINHDHLALGVSEASLFDTWFQVGTAWQPRPSLFDETRGCP